MSRTRIPNIKVAVRQRVYGKQNWEKVAQTVLAVWKAEVMALPNTPASWKAAYIKALRCEARPEGARVIFDPGQPGAMRGRKGRNALYARAVEFGIKPGGIPFRDVLLNGREFVNVPIEHGRSDINKAVGSMAGGKAVWDKLQMLQPGERYRMSNKTSQRMRLHEKHTDAPMRDAFKIVEPFIRTVTRDSAGLLVHAERRQYGSKGSIMTFRRVSVNSKDGKWVWLRKGRTGAHIKKKVLAKIPGIVRGLMG